MFYDNEDIPRPEQESTGGGEPPKDLGAGKTEPPFLESSPWIEQINDDPAAPIDASSSSVEPEPRPIMPGNLYEAETREEDHRVSAPPPRFQPETPTQQPPIRPQYISQTPPPYTTPAPPPSTPEPFYREKVKHDGAKRSRQWFKRAVAIAVIVTLLGAPCIGFTIGFGQKFAESYLTKQTEHSGRGVTPNPETAAPTIDANIFKEEPEPALASNSGGTTVTRGSYAEVIDKVEPSVVTIASHVPYEDPFGGYGSFGFGGGESTGLGSGILFYETDTKYYIVTNFHVIEDASDVSVCIQGSDPITASVVGFDQAQDLAVISISLANATGAGVEHVTLASFGNSDNLQVGDEVLAIGNALGEGNTATNGIVSAKDKEIVVQGRTLEVLQTNAAINPGNSGGPLVNMNGEVIGINTAKIKDSETEGMGYSIPSNVAKPIIQGFMDSINKPYLGVTISTLSDETAQMYNLPSAGAIVGSVVDGSPASKAGIRVNDIITAIDGNPIFTSDALIEEVRNCEIGQVVEIKLIRGGRESVTVNVTMEQRQ